MRKKFDELYDITVSFRTEIQGQAVHLHAKAVANLNDFYETRLEAEYWDSFVDIDRRRGDPIDTSGHFDLSGIRACLIDLLVSQVAALSVDDCSEAA